MSETLNNWWKYHTMQAHCDQNVLALLYVSYIRLDVIPDFNKICVR